MPPGVNRTIRMPAELVDRIAQLAAADRRTWSAWAALALERAAEAAERDGATMEHDKRP